MSSEKFNKQVILKKRPLGAPKVSDFEIIERELPSLKENEVLLKTLCFSLDPYMRGRMSEIKSYMPSLKLGDVMSGSAICRVEESKNPELKVGDLVLAGTGWQTLAVVKPNVSKKLPVTPVDILKLSSDVRPSLFLGVLGLPGFTAYYGLNKIGDPKRGETVVVSAATGGVGALVGQLAKQKGCYVVGIAGGQNKCKYAVDELGFDVCLDRNSKTFREDLSQACQGGIDVYFENVGGDVFFAVFPLLNDFARVPVCGTISSYNAGMTLAESGFSFGQIIAKAKALLQFLRFDYTPFLLRSLIVKRIKLQGLLARDHFDQYEEFIKDVLPLIKSGQIKYKEDITKGFENAPEAFCGLLQGKNFGKVVVEI